MTEQAPDGMFPFFMPNTGAEKYNLKNGPGIVDLVDSRSFNTASILEEIKKYGFMCPFEPCQKHLAECDQEEFIVVCDPTSRYGEMFLLLHTEHAIKAFLSEKEEKENAAKEAEQRQEEEAASAEAARIKRENAVYVDIPILPKQYNSLTADETDDEVKNLSVRNTRPLLSFKLFCPIHIMNQEVNFGDHNTNQSECVNILPQACSTPGLGMSTKNVAVQCAPSTTSSKAQTEWHRKINIAIQYEPLGLDDFTPLNEAALIHFLRRALPLVESSLQENETVDIFCDLLANNNESSDEKHHILPSLDKEQKQWKEIHNFCNLEHSKGKMLTCIDWYPNRKDVVATSACVTSSFNERILTQEETATAHIIVWKFSIQIHPMLVLESPLDCICFRFNPTQPNMVAGGCINGQVVFWNTSRLSSALEEEKSKKTTADDERKEEKRDPPIQIIALSHPELSHKRMVSDLVWLPASTQINAKGKLLPHEYLTTESNQFITVSGDGHALFWDVRFNDIMMGKLPYIAKIKSSKSQQQSKQQRGDAQENDFTPFQWLPLFKIKIKRTEGTGDLTFGKVICFAATSRLCEENEDLRSQLICSAEEGDIVSVNWLPQTQNDSVGDDTFVSPEYVQWMASDHSRSCVAMSQSPFFPNYVITVSDWNFHVWKTDSKPKRPIFSSPDASTHLTGGKWSPTRPSVIILSKVDGSVDVWDLTNTSYSPFLTLILTPSPITSMEFLSNGDANKQRSSQLLAVGDKLGSLHIFEMPQKLSKSHRKEMEAMNFFLERGCGEDECDTRECESISNDDEEKEEGVSIIQKDATNNIAEQTVTKEEDIDLEVVEKYEQAYRDMEKKFLEEHGLSADGDNDS